MKYLLFLAFLPGRYCSKIKKGKSFECLYVPMEVTPRFHRNSATVLQLHNLFEAKIVSVIFLRHLEDDALCRLQKSTSHIDFVVSSIVLRYPPRYAAFRGEHIAL